VLAEHGLVGEHTRLTYLGLEEPPKPEVLGFRPGDPVDRRVRAILLDAASGAATDVVASLTRNAVDSATALDAARDGQPPVMLEDLEAVDEIVKGDSGWRAAMARRGVTDLDLVRPCPLSAGSFGVPGEEGRRMLRVLSFVQHHEKDHPWAHPVDGLVAYVDLIERRVVELVDAALLPIPQEAGNFDDPADVGPARTTLKPIEISQPEGPSFTVDGDEVSWEGWRLRIGFDAREGLTLHQISLWDRPVVYRASIAEMVVPYADPSPARFWQNYFDAGEYLLGQQVNSLMLGCDCLGRSATSTWSCRPRTASRARWPTPSACTKRTSAWRGSTPTCSPAPPRPAASGAWSSRRSSRSATTTTASTGTCTWTARSSWRSRPPG